MDLFYSLDPIYDDDISIKHSIDGGNVKFVLIYYHMTYVFNFPHHQILDMARAVKTVDIECMILSKILEEVPKKYHNEIIIKLLK